MSKGLEVLEKLRQNNKDDTHLFDDELLDIIEKELKALEIIKEKRVNVGVLIHRITDKNLLGLKSYNFMWCGTPERQLTQEEYDLLKEVLK